MRGQHYRLKTPTLAILACADDPEHKIPMTIPQGGVVEVVETDLNGNRLVDVRWEDKLGMMFTTDLRTRGELVTLHAVGV